MSSICHCVYLQVLAHKHAQRQGYTIEVNMEYALHSIDSPQYISVTSTENFGSVLYSCDVSSI